MRRWRAPLGLALVGLTLVPTGGLVAVSAAAAFERASEEEQAEEIAERAARLGDLVELRFAIVREAMPMQAIQAIESFGLDPSMAIDVIGIDLETALAEARVDVDRFAGRAASPAVARTVAPIREVRARSGSATAAQVSIAYARAEESATMALDEALAELRQSAAAARSLRLAHQLAVLGEMVEVQRAGLAALRNLGAQLLPDIPLQGTPLQLAADVGGYDRAAAQLDAMELGGLEEEWRAFRGDSDSQRFERDVRLTLQRLLHGGSDATPVDTASLTDTFSAGVGRAEAIRRLCATSADMVSSTAAGLAAESADAHHRTLLATAVLVLVALGLTAAVARALLRPLRRLERSALAVSSGALEIDHVPESGPRELAVVARAHNEMLANLRALEVQAGALASGALDSPVLRDPVPGRLGDAVQASVAQLSSSLVERDALQRRLAHEASHDGLTGLANRASAVAELEAAVDSGRRTAVLFIDLDEFKRANDTFGHVVGDAVLRRVAAILVSEVRDEDRVARLGGDEFLVIADVSDAAEATALGRRIVAAVCEPLVIEGVPVSIGASVGVALSDEGSTALELLRDADVAVYEAKRSGKRRVELIGDDLRQQVAERADLERHLRAAVLGDGIEVHYQPIVPMSAGGPLVAVEALARWTRPDGRVLPATAFVDVAEAGDFVLELGAAVQRRALRQLATWDAGRSPLAGVPVTVNLSRRELHDTMLPDRLGRLLDEMGVDAGRLILEVNEGILVDDLTVAGERLAVLRRLGCRVAIDDFGEATTAMSVLHLPVDVLKLDRSLVADLHDPRHRTLAELVVDAAHRLGITVVGEGVESRAQLALVRETGCDSAQGHAVAPPMAAAEVERWGSGRQAQGDGVPRASTAPTSGSVT